MSEVRRSPAPALDVVVYGAATCEDTAITRSRLQALRVPFQDIDIDADHAGMARVLALAGRRVTPTVTFGRGGMVVTEPDIERLEELLRSAGHVFDRPAATQIHGSLAGRPIPLRTLEGASGEPFSLQTIRGRLQAAVFFAHDAACLACHGYAKQLAGQADAMREADAMPIVVVRDQLDGARSWTAEMPPGARVLADPRGAWARLVQATLGTGPDNVLLLALDRWAAPRASSAAREAGGLIAPADATDWLRFVALECPECDGGDTWSDPETPDPVDRA